MLCGCAGCPAQNKCLADFDNCSAMCVLTFKSQLKQKHDLIQIVIANLETMKTAWERYKGEPFEAGRVEGAEMAIGMLQKVLKSEGQNVNL